VRYDPYKGSLGAKGLSGFCYQSMAQLWAMDGADTLNIRTVTASVLNKQSQRPDKDWPPAWGF
jgi:hypothetical protein